MSVRRIYQRPVALFLAEKITWKAVQSARTALSLDQCGCFDVYYHTLSAWRTATYQHDYILDFAVCKSYWSGDHGTTSMHKTTCKSLLIVCGRSDYLRGIDFKVVLWSCAVCRGCETDSETKLHWKVTGVDQSDEKLLASCWSRVTSPTFVRHPLLPRAAWSAHSMTILCSFAVDWRNSIKWIHVLVKSSETGQISFLCLARCFVRIADVPQRIWCKLFNQAATICYAIGRLMTNIRLATTVITPFALWGYPFVVWSRLF